MPLSSPPRARRAGQVIWIAVAAVIAGLLTVGAILSASLNQRAEASAKQRLAATAGLAAAFLDEEAHALSNVVESSAQRELVRTVFLAPRSGSRLSVTSNALAASLLEGLAHAHQGIRGAFLTDGSGHILATSSNNKSSIGSDFSFRDWYRGAIARRGSYISEVFRSRAAGVPWTVSITTPVFATPGKPASPVIGLVGISFEVTQFQEFAARFAASNHAGLQLVDQHGNVIADSGGALTGSVVVPGGQTGRVISEQRSLGMTGWTLSSRVPHSEVIAEAASTRRLLWLSVGVLSLLLLGCVGVWTVFRRRADSLESERTAAQRSFLGLLAGTGDLAAVIDSRLRVVGANDAFWRLAKPTDSLSPLQRLGDVLPMEVHEQLGIAIGRVCESAVSEEIQVRVAGADGDLHLLVRIFRLKHNHEIAIIGTDITHQVEANLFFDAVLSASPDMIFVTDLSTNQTTYTSRSLEAMLGGGPSAPRQPSYNSLDQVHPDDRERLTSMNLAARYLADGEVLQMRYRVLDVEQEWRWFSRRITPFKRNEYGVVTEILGLLRDISEIVDGETQLHHASLHDGLTGLPNRVLLSDRLTTAIGRAERSGEEVAVLFCDLDAFKRVNDSSGHAGGDAVLLTISQRLRGILRAEDTIARVGGDEFVIILEAGRRNGSAGSEIGPGGKIPLPRNGSDNLLDGMGIREAALAAAERIRAVLQEPVHFEESEHVVSASVGITFAGRHRDGGPVTADEVLRDADSAMYQAKLRGKDRHEIFESGHRRHLLERARVEQILRNALRSTPPPLSGDATPEMSTDQSSRSGDALAGRLSVAYQPVFDLGSQRLVSFEALARLRDGVGNLLPTELFIAVSEDTGLIGALGSLMLDRACGQLAAWRSEHPDLEAVGMAVNLSAQQAQNPELSRNVFATLARHGLIAADLTLELTETVLLHAGPSTINSLRELHEAGIRIAIDDFGTGYSSLRYLATLPVNAVKVDKSFTAGIPGDPISATIVRAVISLAADLGLDCIVEGIETQEQLDALPKGVLGQGYLLGRPTEVQDVSAQELSRLLAPCRV